MTWYRYRTYPRHIYTGSGHDETHKLTDPEDLEHRLHDTTFIDKNVHQNSFTYTY
jgi:hypothetical protein